MTAHRIDVHHHFVPQVYKDALLALGDACPAPGYQAPLKNWSEQRSLEQMDEAGIATAIVSVTTPGIHFGDNEAAKKLARQCNDAGARMMADWPARFGLFAALPLPDIDASLGEIAYALDALKADGIGLYTSYETERRVRFLGDQEFAPILEELNRRGALVFVHPTSCVCCTDLQPEIADAIIEYGTDTTRTIASLVFSGAAARYPDIRFIFCHAGGTMPHLIQRFHDFSGHMRAPAAAMSNGMMHEVTRFYYDLAQTAHPGPVGCLRKIIPMSQILLGTDFPYGAGCLDQVARVAGCGFTGAELAAVARGNALKLLPCFAPHQAEREHRVEPVLTAAAPRREPAATPRVAADERAEKT